MMKNGLQIITLFIFLFSSCLDFKNKNTEGGYAYVLAKDKQDSSNYILPIKNANIDSLGLENARLLMQAFDEPNISLEGASSPIVRLVLEIRGKKVRIIRIAKGQLITKTYLSGSWYPELDLDRLSEKEKNDYYLLEYNLGYNTRNLTDKMKNWCDSVGKLSKRVWSKEYFEELKLKATVSDKLKYRADTISFSEKQLNVLLDSVNHHDFWNLSLFDASLCEDSYDNGGYTLEVNTKHRFSMVQQTYGC